MTSISRTDGLDRGRRGVQHLERGRGAAAVAALHLEVGVPGVRHGARQDFDLPVEIARRRRRLRVGESGVAPVGLELGAGLLERQVGLRDARLDRAGVPERHGQHEAERVAAVAPEAVPEVRVEVRRIRRPEPQVPAERDVRPPLRVRDLGLRLGRACLGPRHGDLGRAFPRRGAPRGRSVGNVRGLDLEGRRGITAHETVQVQTRLVLLLLGVRDLGVLERDPHLGLADVRRDALTRRLAAAEETAIRVEALAALPAHPNLGSGRRELRETAPDLELQILLGDAIARARRLDVRLRPRRPGLQRAARVDRLVGDGLEPRLPQIRERRVVSVCGRVDEIAFERDLEPSLGLRLARPLARDRELVRADREPRVGRMGLPQHVVERKRGLRHRRGRRKQEKNEADRGARRLHRGPPV